ncbi:MAG: hypothetical protein LH631_12585 [Alkalinema sp. CAN_BIN05]|nr:hypothetical protein [Alkalinema sp. CAN_BIN05]
MTQTPFYAFYKEFLADLLVPFGTVERSFEVPGESKYIARVSKISTPERERFKTLTFFDLWYSEIMPNTTVSPPRIIHDTNLQSATNQDNSEKPYSFAQATPNKLEKLSEITKYIKQ